MLSNPISHKARVASSEVILAGLRRMLEGKFTNMQIAGAFERAGFVSIHPWDSQEIANRLLQRVRKQGLITYLGKGRLWEASPKLREIVERL